MASFLRLQDFARLFGTTPSDFSEDVVQAIDQVDFCYEKLQGDERDKIILHVLQQIESGNLREVGKHYFHRWEEGWAENLEMFISGQYAPETLVPKYVRPNQPLRLDQDYIRAPNSNFEWDYFTVLRRWLFRKYLDEVDAVYEFGCGPGHNLHLLASIFPDKQLYGLDWSPSAVELVNLVGEKLQLDVKSRSFHMFSPDYRLDFQENSAVITMGTLEQLGTLFEAFIEYLVAKSPGLIIHVEPIYELHDRSNLIDYLATKFHDRRKYLVGLLPYLRNMERANRITVHKIQRAHFGSLFHDGWSLVVYSPCRFTQTH